MKKLVMIAVFFCSLFILSCSKKDDNKADDATKFVGTYNMSSACFPAGSQPVTVTTNGTSSIVLPLTLSSGTVCQKFLTIPVSVSGNNVLSNTSTVVDGCNNVFNETITGSINGNTLTLVYVTTNSAGSLTCTFVGSK